MDYVVRPHALASLLVDAAPGIEILSLDCFDTLIWRNVNAPVDVFADLPIAGGAIPERQFAEAKARKLAAVRHARDEVTIDEIYAQLMPHANDSERAAAIERELEAEARHCYAFAPTCALIADAKARGLQVVIVSDTYLPESQLRTLIARAGGEDLAAMIDRIFCSSAFGKPKAAGLFAPVLAELGISPEAILHVGDNKAADQTAPSALGINTVHIRQFDDSTQNRLRLEAVAATVMDPDTRVSIPAFQPHRAQIAMREESAPDHVLGHDVFGPVMNDFAEWIAAEADALEASLGKPVKLLFLLRDGYLPHQAFLTRYPERAERCAAIELSRFTSTAAGFVDADAIAKYLEANIHDIPTSVMAHQMLLSDKEADKLSRDGARKFFARMRQDDWQAKILARSERFGKRLAAYLATKGVAQGDAVMLVDLGYNGSVQNWVEPRLTSAMNLTVAGRYLILRESTPSGLNKRGFLSVADYDNRALRALCESIAIVEQFCTVADGSVIDYREDGKPVRKAADIKGAQSACRDVVQQACLSFIRARRETPGMKRPPLSDDFTSRRRASAAILSRFLSLPTDEEVRAIQHFRHDVNLGTKATQPLVDLDAAQEGMRRRGLFYVKNSDSMFLPGELQQRGIHVNLSLFGSRRYGLDLRKHDFDAGQIDLPILIADGKSVSNASIEAYPTADGYYHALIPIGVAQLTIGLQLCRLYEWVQIEEVRFVHVENVMENGRSLPAIPVYDSMEQTAPGLFRCTAADGIMLVQPPIGRHSDAMALSIVFRPVVARTAPPLAQAA
ncbi:HAD family hydrolase [Sphingomonas sp. C3-2]|uniref:HAD family hydrolase n=1 Tax=Sphingomonas sp. C3-2 TaxID=3062169 RepID=UPI00294B8BD7|nr:HAD family hydrolase [Sphingomonas sp. C3-2]WOK36021.1 HAD hydrolase-like protein [Sphingomonas sp. C3-2]